MLVLTKNTFYKYIVHDILEFRSRGIVCAFMRSPLEIVIRIRSNGCEDYNAVIIETRDRTICVVLFCKIAFICLNLCL